MSRWAGPDRIRRLLASPLALAYAIGPTTIAVLWVLRSLRFVENVPFWQYIAGWLGGAAISTVATVAYARRPTRTTLHFRLATHALAVMLIMYLTGWGPILIVAFTITVLETMAAAGPRSWVPAVLWDIAFVGIGQVGVAAGVFGSFVPTRLANGAAFLGVLGLVYIARMAATAAAQRDEAAAAVQTSEERFRALVQNSSDLIIVLDDAGLPLHVSPACQSLLGLTEDEVGAANLTELVHPDDLERIRAFFRRVIGTTSSSEAIGFRVRHADGTWRHVEAVGADLSGNPAVGGFVLNVRDVTDRKAVEDELARQALHDALTGLPNRTLFLDRLAQSLARGAREGNRPAVLFLDLDRFKHVNDTLGHDAGDTLLIETAARLLTAVRPGDTVARFGGDEFVILCDSASGRAGASGRDVAASGVAHEVADRLLATFTEPFVLGGDPFFISASIGVAEPASDTCEPADLVRDADTAMYRAKDLGRGQVATFDQTARIFAIGRVHTEQLLRHALERDELRVVYQPIIDMQTGAIVSAEALLRWQHPTDGLIGPDRFMSIAEETGLIVPIGEWVLSQACAQMRAWADRCPGTPPIGITVNLSPRQLAEDHLLETIDAVVAAHRIDPVWLSLTLEVTESLLIRDPETANRRLAELKSRGVHLAMDDFGTGYSSLAYLRRFPFDILKIDRTFVEGVGTPRDHAIVKAIIAMAHGLDITVVAEGVETDEQLAVLRELGCDQAQGFRIGRPQSAPRLASSLTGPLLGAVG